jgi:hypothetical protein
VVVIKERLTDEGYTATADRVPNLLQAHILHCNLEPALPVLGTVIVADGAGEPAHVFPRGLELALSLTVEVGHMVVGQS